MSKVKNSMKKTAVVQAYAKLSLAFNECSIAIQEYADQFEGTTDLAASLALLSAAPAVGAAFQALAPASVPAAVAKGKGKRGEHDELDATDAEGPSTSKKARKEKKVVDPNMPKRPASTFIVYQNEVRLAMRAKHPDMPYPEVMKLISADWANLDPTKKQVYVDENAVKSAAYEIEKKAYDDGLIIAAGGVPDPNPPAKRKVTAKKADEAPVAAELPVNGTPAKKSKKDKVVAAAATPVAAAPTPVKKVRAPKAAPVVVAPEEESSEDESSDDSDDSDAGVIQQVVGSTSKAPAPKKKAVIAAPAKKEKKTKA